MKQPSQGDGLSVDTWQDAGGELCPVIMEQILTPMNPPQVLLEKQTEHQYLMTCLINPSCALHRARFIYLKVKVWGQPCMLVHLSGDYLDMTLITEVLV